MPDPDFIHIDTLNMEIGIGEIVGIIIGIYEVFSRVIPTTKGWSLIGVILQAVKKVSDYLDNRKPAQQ